MNKATCWLRSSPSVQLVLCLFLATPITALADAGTELTAAEAVTEAVDYCGKAQQIVDLIIDLAIDGEYADIFQGSSTSSAVKSMAIDMIIDELGNNEDLMIEFGFEPTHSNKELVAEEIYDVACIYYDEMHRDGGSRESANKLSVIELIRFALVETKGYADADAQELRN